MDTDMTSDILIYKILMDSTDKFINKCNLKFVDRSVPASEDDTIYVGNVDLENVKESFNSSEYKALVQIYVKTKNTDYLKGSKFLRTVVKRIKNELRSNVDCKQRRITFRNTQYVYGSKYTLKGLNLLVQMAEYETFNVSDDDFDCMNLDVDVDVE